MAKPLRRGSAPAPRGRGDLFALFERVFRDPRAYGFDNVDTPDRTRSATTALYFDGFHFGYHGHQIIARAIGRAL